MNLSSCHLKNNAIEKIALRTRFFLSNEMFGNKEVHLAEWIKNLSRSSFITVIIVFWGVARADKVHRAITLDAPLCVQP